MRIQSVLLQGEKVLLEPLSLDHIEPLCAVAFDEDLWRVGMSALRSKEDVAKYVQKALELQEKGEALPFATVDRTTKSVVGSTRFGNIDKGSRKVEIGWTWLGKQWQRTGLNTEAKFLMLRHAFEVWKCVRVEFKTDVLNAQSRKAIIRLGAKEEGILRKHAITSSGRVRDSIYYSIVDDEWGGIKQHFLTHLLRK